jgi:hypothetical protein
MGRERLGCPQASMGLISSQETTSPLRYPRWGGVDSAWEQKKLEASPENACKLRRLPHGRRTLCWLVCGTKTYLQFITYSKPLLSLPALSSIVTQNFIE